MFNSKWLGKKLIIKEVIQSTQTEAHKLAKEGYEHGTIVIAEQQTEGKGRLGRSWISERGKGIWMSIILRPTFSIEQAAFITLFTSIVIYRVFKNKHNIDCKIKWPNDIYIGDKKCVGILTEIHTESTNIEYLIIGIGINTNKLTHPESIERKVISLEECLDKVPDKDTIINELINQFEKDFELFNNQGFKAFYDEYLTNMYGIGKKIKINNNIYGIVKGIDTNGHLLVEDSTDKTLNIASGEIKFLD